MIEIKVIVKDADTRLQKEYVEYEEIKLSPDDPILQKHVNNAIAEFRGDAESVVVKIHMDWK